MNDQDTMNFSYFQLRDEHFKDVQYLMRVVFGKRVSIPYLKNKYADYLGLGYFSTIAYDNKKPIGFYGAIPQEFLHNGQKIIVAHACDSYTLKEYQGKRVHYNLARLSYSLMKDKQVHFVYAFHSENTYHSTKKLDWKEREKLTRFHIDINTFPFAKVYKKLKLQRQFQNKVQRILSPYKKTDFKYLSNYSHQLVTPIFLKYKEGMSEHHIVEIENCVFYLKVDTIIRVGLFAFKEYENFLVAIEKLKEMGNRIGVNEILFQVSENSEMYHALKRVTSPQPSWILGYLKFREVDVNQFEFAYMNLDTF